MANLIGSIKFHSTLASGEDNALGFVYTYEAGTLTPLATYTDITGNTQNANPVALDITGRASIWLDRTVAYKFVSVDSALATVPDGTVDNISAPLTYPDIVSGGALIEIERNATGAVPATLDAWHERMFYNVRSEVGAVGDGVADDGAALQAAITAAAASGRGLYIPAGTYLYTTELTIPGGLCWMFGDGNGSILKPSGCNGLRFTVQAVYAGSRKFENFFLSATSGSSYSAIYATMTSASGEKVNGAHFSNITIQGFGYAINTQGFWTCSYKNLFVYNCHQGVLLSNRNVKNTFDNCYFIAGTSPGGGGTRYGFNFTLDAGVRTEDALIDGCYIYGWDTGVAVANALYVTIDACDIDIIQGTCVQIVTGNGGCTVRDSWLNTTVATASYGVVLSALGSDIYDGVTIENNHISCSTSHASSIGVTVGNNQSGTRVLNNRISGFPVGIDGDAESMVTRDNKINASTTAIIIDSSASISNSIGPDTIQAGTPLVFSSGGSVPAGLQYWASGSFTITLTGMTAGTTGTVTWRSDGGIVTLSTAAAITGTSNTTAMTGTGAPQAIWPASAQVFSAAVVENGTYVMARATISAVGVVTYTASLAGAAFTNSGTKGYAPQTVTYQRA